MLPSAEHFILLPLSACAGMYMRIYIRVCRNKSKTRRPRQQNRRTDGKPLHSLRRDKRKCKSTVNRRFPCTLTPCLVCARDAGAGARRPGQWCGISVGEGDPRSKGPLVQKTVRPSPRNDVVVVHMSHTLGVFAFTLHLFVMILGTCVRLPSEQVVCLLTAPPRVQWQRMCSLFICLFVCLGVCILWRFVCFSETHPV